MKKEPALKKIFKEKFTEKEERWFHIQQNKKDYVFERDKWIEEP